MIGISKGINENKHYPYSVFGDFKILCKNKEEQEAVFKEISELFNKIERRF